MSTIFDCFDGALMPFAHLCVTAVTRALCVMPLRQGSGETYQTTGGPPQQDEVSHSVGSVS